MTSPLKLFTIGIGVSLACTGMCYIIHRIDPRTITTTSGATFTVEKGWIVSQCDDRIIVQIQVARHKLTVALLENTQDSADNAVLAAWQKIQPSFTRKFQKWSTVTTKDGWDEIAHFYYVTSTKENLFLRAIARRVNKTWYVFLIDGSSRVGKGAGAFRGLNLILSSFTTRDREKKLLADKHARPLDDFFSLRLGAQAK